MKNIAHCTVSFFLLLWLIQPVQAQDAYNALKSRAGGLRSSFSANFALTTSGGMVRSGKLYYQAPNKLHVKMSGGGVIATNGRQLVIYNPGSVVAAKQDVGGASGGLFSTLRSYTGSIRGNSYVFTKPGAYYEEIVVTVRGKMIASVRMRHEDQVQTFSFSNVKVGRGIKASLFSFRPPTSVRIIENPMNR